MRYRLRVAWSCFDDGSLIDSLSFQGGLMTLRPLAFVATPIVFAVIAACSSSNSSSSAPPSCQGAKGTTGAGSSACSSCLQNSCGSQVSAVNSACGAYVACFQGCMCGDFMCLVGCAQTKIDAACSNSYMPLQNCLMQSCGQQCNQTVNIGAE